jgi:hypothetical protein
LEVRVLSRPQRLKPLTYVGGFNFLGEKDEKAGLKLLYERSEL